MSRCRGSRHMKINVAACATHSSAWRLPRAPWCGAGHGTQHGGPPCPHVLRGGVCGAIWMAAAMQTVPSAPPHNKCAHGGPPRHCLCYHVAICDWTDFVWRLPPRLYVPPHFFLLTIFSLSPFPIPLVIPSLCPHVKFQLGRVRSSGFGLGFAPWRNSLSMFGSLCHLCCWGVLDLPA